MYATNKYYICIVSLIYPKIISTVSLGSIVVQEQLKLLFNSDKHYS